METRMLSEAEATEFEEFQRMRRETEAELTLRKLVVDASRRGTDRHTLNTLCDVAKKAGAFAVLVSPVHVASARRRLGEGETAVACTVGGTGESVASIKQKEARRAVREGASIIRLIPCYSALFGGNGAYLKKEIKKVRRAAKKCRLVLSLDDHALTKADVERGMIAATEARADAVSVRGETELSLMAVRLSAGRLGVETSGVENAEQLRMLLKTGAEYALTAGAEHIAEELYRAVEQRRGAQAKNGDESTKKIETAQ